MKSSNRNGPLWEVHLKLYPSCCSPVGLYWPRYLDHFSAAAPEPERVRGPGQQRGAVLSLLACPRDRSRDSTETRPGDHIHITLSTHMYKNIQSLVTVFLSAVLKH